MTSFTTSTLNYPQGSNTPIKRVYVNRPPTPNDITNFVPGDEWLDKVGRNWWKLVNANGPQGALWVKIGASTGTLETFTGDVGGPVGPDGFDNINLKGTAGQIEVSGNPATHTLTLSLIGGGSTVDSLGVDASTAPGTDPVLPDGSGKIDLTGEQVGEGVIGANVIQTNSLAANQVTIRIQQSGSAAAEDTTKNGVAHFDSTQFTVSNGFVSLVGSTGGIDSVEVDAATAPGTNPVLPDGAGLITVTGNQVAAGTVGAHVLRTDSLAAHTYTMEIQQADAVAAEDTTKNGVAHFDSSQFTVTNGFVTITGGTGGLDSLTVDAHTAPGTNPVLPDGGGTISITGGQVAASTVGANVIRTDSLAANAYTIQVQQAGSAASQDTTKNGVAHFNSSEFTVTNGFVSLVGGSEAVDSIGVDTSSGAGTNPVLPTAGGLVTVTGGQTAPGTIANVIRTDSLAANTYTVEIQQTSAVAAKDTTKNGVAHFNSLQFTNDQGFISIVGGEGPLESIAVQAHTAPGTNPVLATAGGQITVNGGTVTAGTTPVQTNSLAANTYTLQVQTAQAIAATDATKIGLASFNSAAFSCDANGFVGLNTGSSKCSFLALAAEQDNVTGDGTQYTVQFTSSLVFNNGSGFDGTSTFTAPVTGYYQFTVVLTWQNITSAMTVQKSWIEKNGTATVGRFSEMSLEAVGGTFTANGSCFVNLTAGDTIIVITQIGESTKTASLQGNSGGPAGYLTYFGGFLVA